MRRHLRGLAVALCALAAGCAAPAAFQPASGGRLTLSCSVSFEIVSDGAPEMADQSVRTVWLDLERGLYALSEFGDTRIDDEWAQAMATHRAEHDGLVPVLRRKGAFVCFALSEEGQCVHGVDTARRLYAFSTPVVQTGGGASGVMRGRGRCAETADAAWPNGVSGGAP